MKNSIVILILFVLSSDLYGMIKEFDRSYKLDTILIPKPSKKSKASLPLQKISGRETLTKDGLEFSYGIFKQTLDYTNDPTNGVQTIEASSASSFLLKWNMSSNTRFQPIMILGIKKIEFDEKTNSAIFQRSENLINMGAGVRYYLGRRWNLVASVNVEQEHFINYTTPDTEKVAMTKLHLDLEGTLWTAGKWSGDILAGVFYSGGKDSADLTVDAGLGYQAAFGMRKWISGRSWYRIALLYETEGQAVAGTGFTADANRSSTGLRFRLGTSF